MSRSFDVDRRSGACLLVVLLVALPRSASGAEQREESGLTVENNVKARMNTPRLWEEFGVLSSKQVELTSSLHSNTMALPDLRAMLGAAVAQLKDDGMRERMTAALSGPKGSKADIKVEAKKQELLVIQRVEVQFVRSGEGARTGVGGDVPPGRMDVYNVPQALMIFDTLKLAKSMPDHKTYQGDSIQIGTTKLVLYHGKIVITLPHSGGCRILPAAAVDR